MIVRRVLIKEPLLHRMLTMCDSSHMKGLHLHQMRSLKVTLILNKACSTNIPVPLHTVHLTSFRPVQGLHSTLMLFCRGNKASEQTQQVVNLAYVSQVGLNNSILPHSYLSIPHACSDYGHHYR